MDTILERDLPLSRSLIWRLQRDFYAEQGAKAWQSVPHYITNTPFFARRCAAVTAAFVRDAGLDHPLVVELGAGSGRFGFLFLRALAELLDRPFTYIFSDFNQANLDFLRAHPRLAPWVERGLADFCTLDVESTRTPRLLHSGRRLRLSEEPPVFLANYLLGALPQEIVKLQKGQPLQGRPIFRLLPPSSADETPIGRLLLPYEVEFHPLDPPPTWARLVQDYPEGQPFLFPCAAVDCLAGLSRLSGGRHLLLAADKAVYPASEWNRWAVPPITRHGDSVSMPVDLQVLTRLVEEQGGTAFEPAGEDPAFRLLGVAAGLGPHQLSGCHQTFEGAFRGFGPTDLLHLCDALQASRPGLDAALQLLELADYCPRVLCHLSGRLGELLESSAQQHDRTRVLRALEHVEASYFPKPGDDFDLPTHLGRLFHLCRDYRRAARWWGARAEAAKPRPEVLTNQATCLYLAGRPQQAAQAIERALLIDPSFAPARKLQSRLKLPAPRFPVPRPSQEAPVVCPETLLGAIDDAQRWPRAVEALSRLSGGRDTTRS